MTQHSMSYRIESDDDGLASTLKKRFSWVVFVAFWESLTKKIQIKKFLNREKRNHELSKNYSEKQHGENEILIFFYMVSKAS
jgi:hypothetical protein